MGMGSVEARGQLAEMLYHGQHGVQVDRREAFRHYEAAAQAGDPNAMYNAGVVHLKGNKDVPQNQTRAVELFKQAAKKNFTMALNSLGYVELVLNGNYTAALEYFQKCYEIGDPEGTFNYGTLLETGYPGVAEPN